MKEEVRGIKSPLSCKEEVEWINTEYWYMYKVIYARLEKELFKNIDIVYGTT